MRDSAPQVWRNHLPIIGRLIGAGAVLDAADGESGWCVHFAPVQWGLLCAWTGTRTDARRKH
jgi:hypothetical protein